MSNNYTPTTWIAGKTIGTADVMNNIENGITEAHDRLDVVNEQFNTKVNKHDLVVNVKDFGAKGDNVNDDAISIRLAINYLKNQGGGTLYFPKGIYLLVTKLEDSSPTVFFNLDFSNIHIIGDNAILKVDNNCMTEALFGNFMYEELENIIFDSLIIDINGQNNLQTNPTGRSSKAPILLYFGKNVHVRKCKFMNLSGEHGVYVGMPLNQNNGKNIIIENCEFKNVADTIIGNEGILDHSSIYATGENIHIFNNKFENSSQSMRATAIECNGKNVFEYGNYIYNYNIPFITATLRGSWNGGNYQGIRNINIKNVNIFNNIAESVLDGWWIENSEDNCFNDVKFHDNIIKFHDDLKYGTRMIVRGGTSLSKKPVNISIYNNHFESEANYSLNQGITSGIDFQSCKGLKIYNNTIKNIAGLAIRIRSLSINDKSTDIEIYDNMLLDVCSNSVESFVKAININGHFERVIIKNNTIKNVNHDKCITGIELWGGDSKTNTFKDVSIIDNIIDVKTNDIESYNLDMNTSSNVFIKHTTTNTNFDVVNKVMCSNYSEIFNPITTEKWSKRGAWMRYDYGTTRPVDTGQVYQGWYRENRLPAEEGNVGSKFVVMGWICVETSSTGGRWVVDRRMTGN